MASYRKHCISKRARVAHKRREKARKLKLGGLASFTYSDARGLSRKRLSSRMGMLG